MLFYGPSGAGKKTRIACVLRELFGKSVEKVRLVNLDPCASPLNIIFIAQN